jgi:hypothetical protein
MARKATKAAEETPPFDTSVPATVAGSSSRELTPFEQEMEREAKAAAGNLIDTGSGVPRFSFRNGILSYDGTAIPGNAIGAVVLDYVYTHAYYEGKFDASKTTPPTCFAFGRGTEADMVPHKVVFEAGQAQNKTCHGCQWNEFGSDLNGRKGKACKLGVRVAVMAAGTMENGVFKAFKKNTDYETALMGEMQVSVTNVKNFNNFVKTANTTLRRPPYALFTKIQVHPDPTNQIKVTFDVLGEAPPALVMEVLQKRARAATATIDAPYPLAEPAAPEKPTARGGRKPRF